MNEHGSGNGGASMAASSELHLKMSKKIAQLTKVIFHLNTRNEDFQLEVAQLKQNHAFELAQLTQDATTKLKSLSDQLTSQQERALHAEQQAAREKQQFLKDVAVFQQQAATQLTTAQQDFQRRVQMLEEQVESSRGAFVERIQQLTQMAETRQQSQQNNTKEAVSMLQHSHAQELETLKKKHIDEVAQLVTSSNGRYNNMLAEQLRLQDELRSEQSTMRNQYEEAARMNEQKLLSQLAQQQHSAETRIENMKTQLVGKMELLLADAETLRGQETKLRQEKEDWMKQQCELQRQLKLLELQVTKAQYEVQSVRKDGEVNMSKVQQQLASSSERIDQLTQELETSKKALVDRDVALNTTVKERDVLQLELLRGSASVADKISLLQQQMLEKELRITNLLAELQLARQQAGMTEAQNQKKLGDLEAQLVAKERDLGNLQQQLANTELLRATLQREKEKLTRDLLQKQTDSERFIQDMGEQHAGNLQELQTSHSQAMMSQRHEMEKRLAEMEVQMKKSSTDLVGKALVESQEAHAQEIERLKLASRATEAMLRQDLNQLQTRMDSMQVQLAQKERAHADVEARSADLTLQLKKAEAELVTLREDKAALSNSSQKMQKEREELFQKQFKEYTAQHESAIKRLTSEKERFVTDHKQALMQMVRDHAEKIARSTAEWENAQAERLRSQNTDLTAFYEKQLCELKNQMEQHHEESETVKRLLKDAHNELGEARQLDAEYFRGKLIALTVQMDGDRAHVDKQHRLTIEKLTVAHTAELSDLTAKLKEEKEELFRSTCEQSDRRRLQLVAQHEGDVEKLRQQNVEAIKALQEASAVQRNSEALAMRAEMTQRLRDLRLQKEQEASQALLEAKTAHDTQYGVLEKKADLLQHSLAQCTSDLRASREECERLSATLEAKTRELSDKLAATERHYRNEMELLKAAAKRDMDRLLEENLTETKQLSDQFEETKRLMLEKVTFLKQTIVQWEERYARRESRPEDVNRISDLEHLVAEKDALVRQTLDEMAYFKRELLNREEMYNKTFARTPNVGVLNVLKPHVQLQAQMQSTGAPSSAGLPMQSQSAPQTKRKTKPMRSSPEEVPVELQRRNSNGAVATRKSLPPLNNNQMLA
ncbi:hypothetical protein Poli38472_011350 [Pythium oligandrum]|uniref:Protein FAM184A/B N-terminal domain-containing protein n=1 Tax=Pythium oligandrum TaxID=41045 RepID=A0A8K1FI06_PYTOL|nr:hypothetical protein Poli38472_011350 [Pythium oligandrum]|eukprot:TMW64470.1 hypothetical protein Poli38472_011350 [Pythium oligandrum]